MIFRVQKNKNYTTMSNYHLRDKNLSLKAKGLLSWMLSNEDSWDYSIAGIVACCKEGETTINTALRELQEFGYVKIIKCKPDDTNNRIHYEYNVYEQPQDIESLALESQVLESQALENQVQRSTKERNTNIRNTKKEKSKDTDTKTSKSRKLSLWNKCVALIDEFTDDAVLRDCMLKALKLFTENSREAGVPFYTNTFKGKINKLQTLSSDTDTQIKIVSQTVDNGWNNFYELKKTYTRKTGDASRDLENLSAGLNSRAKKGGTNDGTKF